MGVRAEYDNGEAIANAAVSVYEPGNDDTPWLSGTTDDKGRFSFIPDADGEWTVRIKDSQGHATSSVYSVGNRLAKEEQEEQEEPARKQSVMQFVVALAIIFGLFGVFSLLRRR
jgi:nickel transport protein